MGVFWTNRPRKLFQCGRFLNKSPMKAPPISKQIAHESSFNVSVPWTNRPRKLFQSGLFLRSNRPRKFFLFFPQCVHSDHKSLRSYGAWIASKVLYFPSFHGALLSAFLFSLSFSLLSMHMLHTVLISFCIPFLFAGLEIYGGCQAFWVVDSAEVFLLGVFRGPIK